jgi:hypothetical protein
MDKVKREEEHGNLQQLEVDIIVQNNGTSTANIKDI